MKGIGLTVWSVLALGACAPVDGASEVAEAEAAQRAPRPDDAPRACAGCHPGEHAEWSRSMHAAAWVDPIFQAEFARRRPPWCVGCHAPRAPDWTAPRDDDPRVAEGVGCAGCHLRAGKMIAARRRPGSPHQSIIDPAFGSAAFCAGCHEFSFPVLDERGRLVRYTEEPMQATVSQFFASEASSALECVDCHGSPAGHAFPGSHDPAMVARAVDLQLCRDCGSLAAVLTNTGAAHHVPTGGVHRRMVLRAWHPRAPERLIEGVIGRRFEALAGGGKETISDTTIAPGESFRLTVPLRDLKRAEGDAAVNLELRYIYALDERAELAGAPASRRILHRRIDPADLSTCGG